MNADAGLLVSGVRLQVTVLSLLNARANDRANDIQYYYTSRLAGEASVGRGDVHFHPVESRQLRISLD